MSNEIYRINSSLPTTTKIEELNAFILTLEGLVANGKFDRNEIDNIFDVFGIGRKYKRDIGIGNTLATYTGWTHLHAESGYSIWKYTPTDYKYNSLNNLYFDGTLYNNKGEATSETALTFTKAWFYDGALASYEDVTIEIGTEGGTEFEIMNAINDYLYVGYTTTFGGIKFEMQTRGSNYTNVIEYWNGSAWVALSPTTNSLVDGTSNFQSDGAITWTVPLDWATNAVNGDTEYWIRISTSTIPVTVAELYYGIPYNSVISLLAMSSSEVLAEEWKWCSYDDNIYVTIRNTGDAAYEGDYYIASTSSTTNKQNFFIYNHQFTADYEDSTWTLEVVNITNASFGSSVDGGGETIITGRRGSVTIPYRCVIESWTVLGDELPGNIVFDIYKCPLADYPSTSDDSIIGSGGTKPYLSSERYRTSSTLTGWNTLIEADSVLTFNVDSCDTLIFANIILKVRKV